MAETNSSRGHKTTIKVGDRFGLWTVLSEVNPDPSDIKYRKKFLAQCECGTVRVHRSDYLFAGKSTACGCIRKKLKTKHGLHKTAEYAAWQSMKNRCLNSAFKQFCDYGGRGIKVCDNWLGEDGFNRFLKDMGKKPSKAHSLDRVDVNGDYEPSNCRWATKTQQQNNRRDNHYIEWNGVKKTVTEWARDIGAATDTIKHRIKVGWPLHEALTKPPYHKTSPA